ncbi:MAG: OmpH family outer membrane protein [Calditrichaeota bacterium]|nr:OmpH family outer membrane protein [Calditrichota bacterium]
MKGSPTRGITSRTLRLRNVSYTFCLWLIVGCAGTARNGSSSGGGPAFPWTGSGVKIGYVRSDVLTQRLPEYRDAENALKRDSDQWQVEADSMEALVRVKESELEELRLILSAERRKVLEDELTQMRKASQKFKQDTWFDENSRYMKRRRELMEPLDARVTDAIYKVAAAEGLDVIFDTIAGNIVYVKPTFDITEKVIEELQK